LGLLDHLSTYCKCKTVQTQLYKIMNDPSFPLLENSHCLQNKNKKKLKGGEGLKEFLLPNLEGATSFI